MTEIRNTVGTPIWEGLGTAIDKGTRFRSSEEMVEALGLSWTVRTEPLISQRTGHQLGKYREVIRNGDDAHMGIVKDRYLPIQNVDAFGFLPQVCREYGMQIVNGGVVGNGSRIWVVAKVGEQIFENRILPNGEKDQIDHHLLFWNSFDGSTSCRIAAIPHAIWCANALASAWESAEGNRWSIRHTRSAPQRLSQAMEQIPMAMGWMAAFSERLVCMEQERFTAQQMRAYAEGVIDDVRGVLDPKRDLGTKKDGTQKADQATNSRAAPVDKMVTLFEGEGASCRGASQLDAYQAVTEYIDHHRRRAARAGNAQRQAAARFEETVFGYNSNRFRKAALARLN